MVVFDRQIYFAQMEWGDESNKQWFKIAQLTIYLILYNNQINARALIGQLAMFYCTSKLMEKSRVF